MASLTNSDYSEEEMKDWRNLMVDLSKLIRRSMELVDLYIQLLLPTTTRITEEGVSNDTIESLVDIVTVADVNLVKTRQKQRNEHRQSLSTI